MADAEDSKSSDGDIMWVRAPSPVCNTYSHRTEKCMLNACVHKSIFLFCGLAAKPPGKSTARIPKEFEHVDFE